MNNGYLNFSVEELTQALTTLQSELSGRPLEDYSIQYCLHHPAVAAAVPGASSINQVTRNVHAGSANKLTAYELKVIKSTIKPDYYKQHR